MRFAEAENLMPRGRLLNSLCSLLFAFTIALSQPARSEPAEQAAGTRLEEYLKRLRYEVLELKRMERHDNDAIRTRKGWQEPKAEERFSINAEIGGKKVSLLIDSGCSMTIVDESLAKRLKTLGQLGVELEDSVLGTLTNSSLVLVDKLVLGRAQFLNQPATVEKIRFDFVHAEDEGILGYDFLRRNHCVLDCGRRQLYVRGAAPSDQESKALSETLRRSGFVPVEMNWVPSIEVKLNGHPTRLLVDTGAPWTLLDDAYAKELSLNSVKVAASGTLVPTEMYATLVGLDSVGAHKVHVVKVNTLQMGESKWSDVHFGVVALKAWKLESSVAQGFLGRDKLVGDGALMDFASNTLWLRPEKKKRAR
jgi:predicted aspartyl protease